VTGVGAALRKGDPVIVVGHVYTSEYEDRDGNRRSSVEMRATAVGPDLSRSIVRILEKTGPGRDADQVPSTEERAAESGDDTDTAESGEEGPVDGEALPLSA
jgi:single-strand DNA-binding protein